MLRPSSDQRRTAILDAVVRVIIDIGYTEMTVADVAKAAGVSSALVHYHFSSKSELISAALRAASDDDKQFRESVAADEGSALSRIERVLCESLPDDANDGSWLLWIETWGETRRSAEIRNVMAELDEHETAVLERLIAEGEQAGEFECADHEGAAACLTALRDGLVIEYTLFQPEQSPVRMTEHLRGAIKDNLGLTREAYERLSGRPLAGAPH